MVGGVLKWLRKNWSITLNVVLAMLIILVIIPESEEVVEVDLSNYTQNNLAQSIDVDVGMSKQDMLKIMGAPVIKEIANGLEEFHYCKTGSAFDEFISIKTQDNKVKSMEYVVASQDDVAFYYVSIPPIEYLETLKAFDCKHSILWREHPRSVTHDVNTAKK